jgi:hypothetical protein
LEFLADSNTCTCLERHGLHQLFRTIDSDATASYRETEQSIILGRPLWATAAFGIAVFAGALGSTLLILKRSIALCFFIASLIGVVVTTVYTISVGIDFSTGELVGIVAMPTVVAVFLVWYARYVTSRGWIKTI